MRQILRKIKVWQTSKVLVLTEALVAAIASLIILIPIGIVVGNSGVEERQEFFGAFGAFGYLSLFFLYLLLFMVFRVLVLALYFWAYNIVAKWVGGAEGSLEPPTAEK